MFLNIRFQLSALCFFVIALVFYLRYKRLPTISNKIFTAMLSVTGINIVFDIITVYTVTYKDTVSPLLNRACHQIFIASLITFVYLFYTYVFTITHKQTSISMKIFFINSLPFVISMFVVMFGTIEYHNKNSVIYSYGSMADAIYVSVTIYSFMILYNFVKFNSIISNEKKIAIIGALLIEIMVGIIQFSVKGFLVSGFGIVLMFTFIYFSLENPKENIEPELGTFNKHALTTMLEEYFKLNKKFQILIVSLDDLTTINFRFGQKFGNQIIQNISDYLSKSLNAYVFHPQGKALCLILNMDKEDAVNKCNSLCDCFDRIWTVNNVDTTFKVRMSLLSCPEFASSDDEVYDAIEFYCLEKFSSNITNCVEEFDESYVKEQKRYSTIETLVSHAVLHDGFDVFYQPIYSTRKNCFNSAEALIRLKDSSTIGFVSPEEFIPIAEKNGLIMDVGIIVMEKVCDFAKRENLVALGIEYLEINLSGLQCMDNALSCRLRKIMDKYDLSPNFFNFEITETVAADKCDTVIRNMNTLIEMGSSFSMDDFGSGNSNLSKIADLPFQLVKMDKSLVWAYFEQNNKKGKVILPFSIGMINQLDMSIVAEGVETEEHKNILSEMGVEYLQGYYFSRPVPENILLDLLNNQRLVV